jgi:hypothetical protein
MPPRRKRCHSRGIESGRSLQLDLVEKVVTNGTGIPASLSSVDTWATVSAVTDLIETAPDMARELLKQLPDRLAHTEAVARKAEEVSVVFEADQAADLVAAAWLHDIGYAQWLVGEGMHALDGGWFLQERKFPERVCQLVAHHSGARFEARERGLLDRLKYSFPAGIFAGVHSRTARRPPAGHRGELDQGVNLVPEQGLEP